MFDLRWRAGTVPTALITGASRGLGRAILRELAADGWNVIADGRDESALRAALESLTRDGAHGAGVTGDVADAQHRETLVARVREMGALDLLVNNASELGPSPLPPLAAHPMDMLERVYRVNVLAPLALVQLLLPEMSSDGVVVNVSSDAAVEAYEHWGGYGSSKAALDHLTAVLAVENPQLRWYAFDPGDMRTAMHQAAFPGEDISDLPEPEAVVPALLRLLGERPPSGRYRAADLLTHAGVSA